MITAVAVPTLFACLEHPLKPVEYDLASEKKRGVQLTVNKDVDILCVIDNSGSMGEEQANVSANFASFIDVLDEEGVEANYRIGVTTTDNGNPRCEGTGPEGGKLQMTSCRSRRGEFVFTGTPMVDVTEIACLDNCSVDDMNIQATATEHDPDLKPRPWLENIEGRTNLPDSDNDGTPDYSTVEAFQCFGPQGVAGCGFESHLESMYLAFLHGATEGDNQYDFVRESALLSVVFVTDEVDCSNNKDHQSIFSTEQQGGSRSSIEAFWSDPDAASPSSAVCWNAGVACTGGAGHVRRVPLRELRRRRQSGRRRRRVGVGSALALHRLRPGRRGQEARVHAGPGGPRRAHRRCAAGLRGGQRRHHLRGRDGRPATARLRHRGRLHQQRDDADRHGTAARARARVRRGVHGRRRAQPVLDLCERLLAGTRGDRERDPGSAQAGVHARVRRGHGSDPTGAAGAVQPDAVGTRRRRLGAGVCCGRCATDRIGRLLRGAERGGDRPGLGHPGLQPHVPPAGP